MVFDPYFVSKEEFGFSLCPKTGGLGTPFFTNNNFDGSTPLNSPVEDL